MKTLFLATAAVAAFVAAPAFAQSGPVGSVGVSYSNAEAKLGGIKADSDNYAVDGVVAIDAFQGWTATFAGSIAHNDDANNTTHAGPPHLAPMGGSDVRAGAFVGAADFGSDTAWTVGGEVQKYLANATLTGTLAYTTADDADIDALTIGADAAYYAMANLRLNAGVSYSDVDVAGFGADLWTYGVGAEYEIANTPFSVVGGYTRGDLEDLKVDTWTVGLRYSFGGGLQARDRAGAALPGAGISSILAAF